MTRADLLEIVYRFHPRHAYPGTPEFDDTDQRRRQLAAARSAADEYPKWQAMLGRLRAHHSVTDLSLYMMSGADFDSAYSAYLLKAPGDGDLPPLAFHVSILAPYYMIRHNRPPRDEPRALDLATEIEATYGYEPVPPELGDVVVPGVVLNGGTSLTATINACLFSSSWGDGLPPWM